MTDIVPERIETDRLRLERLGRETVDPLELYRICSSDDGIDEVTAYLPWSPHRSVDETASFIEERERDWEDRESVTYVIRPRDGEAGAGQLAGLAGLAFAWDRLTARLGVWLRRRFWGRGYSGERAAALMEVAFDRLDLDAVAVTHQVGNERSRRAIEQYVEAHGGRREGRLRNWSVRDGAPVDEVRYTVSREEYVRATSE